jgi:hypothetical protein
MLFMENAECGNGRYSSESSNMNDQLETACIEACSSALSVEKSSTGLLRAGSSLAVSLIPTSTIASH